MIRVLRGLWARFRSEVQPRHFSRLERVSALGEVPDNLRGDTIYLAGVGSRIKWVVFLCPCGRGHRVSLSLQTSHYPHWQLNLRGARATLYPSIDVPNEWRCHYWIRSGRVLWAPSWPTGARSS